MLRSYKDIDITESEKILNKTKEYVEEKGRLLELFKKNEITMSEVNSKLRTKMTEIKKYMHNKRRRNKKSLEEKIKKIESVKVINKEQIECKFEDLNENDIELYRTDKLSINIPKISYILNNHKIMMKGIDENDKKLNISSFVTFDIHGTNIFHGYVKKLDVLNKNFPEKYKEEINKVISRIPDYESEGTICRVGKIKSTLTTYKWECINNWWKDHDNNIKYKKYLDFTLFLASDKDKNCVQQCVEELGGIWNENLEFEEMIPQKKIITYIPLLEDMNHVLKLNDLITDYDEDVFTNDCENVARIIKYNGHMGVITKITEFKPKGIIQGRKRINMKGTNILEVFMDIESLTEEINTKNKRQIPYLICWNYEGNEVKRNENKGCIAEFVKDLMLLSQNHEEIILYAWYGSGYDYQHIIPALKKYSDKTKFTIRDSSIIFGEIHFSEINFTITLKDPYLFILTSLDKAAKAFKVLNKGSFPHKFIKSWDDLEKILPKWGTIQQRIIEEKDDNKLGITVKREDLIKYENGINNKTIMEKAIEYCEIDVLAMKQVWLKFNRLIEENLGMKINKYTFTLSQLSMALMEATFEPHHKLMVPDLEKYNFLKEGIYGGRVVAKNGIYNEDILYADVVSLYPSAMKLLEHGYGDDEEVTQINYNKLGVYKVKLTHKCDMKPHNYLEFVPRRIDGKLKWNWFKEHIGTYHTYDLLIAQSEGFNIECISGVEYKYKGNIFNKFIDKLYNLKEEHSSCNCEEKPCPIRMIAKIALNGGGYGKFVQKPIEKEVYIVKRDVVANECNKIKGNENDKIFLGQKLVNRPIFYNLDGEEYDKMVIERDERPVYATQQGISILSGSRYRLYNLCKQFPGLEIIYSDTDSVFIKKSSIDHEKFNKSCSTDLGSLDNTLENSDTGIIRRMIIGGPKMYGYEYTNNQGENEIKLYCKGVPKSMLNIEQLEFLLNNKDSKLVYEFDILKRKLTGIQEMSINKNIHTT